MTVKIDFSNYPTPPIAVVVDTLVLEESYDALKQLLSGQPVNEEGLSYALNALRNILRSCHLRNIDGKRNEKAYRLLSALLRPDKDPIQQQNIHRQAYL